MDDNFYVHIKSEKNKSSRTEFSTKLSVPIYLRLNHNLTVGLASLSYVNDTTEKNVAKLPFKICIPKYVPPKPPAVIPPAPDEIVIGDFIESYLEPGNYCPAKFVESLNREILAKFPASCNPNVCRFVFNSVIQRVQLRVDGGLSTPANSRCTVLLYGPIARVLGFSKSSSERVVFPFGGPLPKAVPRTIEARHATASLSPYLPRSRQLYIYLSCLEPEVSNFDKILIKSDAINCNMM